MAKTAEVDKTLSCPLVLQAAQLVKEEIEELEIKLQALRIAEKTIQEGEEQIAALRRQRKESAVKARAEARAQAKADRELKNDSQPD